MVKHLSAARTVAGPRTDRPRLGGSPASCVDGSPYRGLIPSIHGTVKLSARDAVIPVQVMTRRHSRRSHLSPDLEGPSTGKALIGALASAGDAVHNKCQEIRKHDCGLAELADELSGGSINPVVRRGAADQLDDLRHRHRVHEMDADELFGAVRGGREPRDGDRGGVGGNHRVRPERGAEIGEDLALHLLVLGRRLDDDVAGREIVVAEGGADALERRLMFDVGDRPLPKLTIWKDRCSRLRRCAGRKRRTCAPHYNAPVGVIEALGSGG